ncbi:hypothetical protein IWX63_001288 [Arthrobacter sp. CAN_A2]|uniref:hypothetical protein n=1 Tax=Arthrobacter sp. CAN_A2 TaxID=2787718 RepID=UPI0018F03EE3
MAKKPHNFEWIGFTEQQRELLNFIDFIGNNGWARNSQTDEIMTKQLAECAEEGLSIDQIIDAMQAIGYDERTCRQLKRWESKRLTGKFGR